MPPMHPKLQRPKHESWESPDSGSESKTPRPTSEHSFPTASNIATLGDTFTAGSFRNAYGQLGYKLYVPPNLDVGPHPLVVMLHGCTQDADDFAAGTAMNEAARERGFYVLYPVQSSSANPQKCWNWFKHNHQHRGRGEPSILAGMTREVIDVYAVDAARVYVAGLSAGGAMAAILAKAYPDLYSAAAVHSGLPPGVASDLLSGLSAMNGGAQDKSDAQVCSGVPTIVFHGDRDRTVHPRNAEGVIAASAGPNLRDEPLHVPTAIGEHHSTRHVYRNFSGEIIAERWDVHGAGHAWFGGTQRGSYTDQAGPNATFEILRFFFEREFHSPP